MLADGKFLKCLIAIKSSENRVATIQIVFISKPSETELLGLGEAAMRISTDFYILNNKGF